MPESHQQPTEQRPGGSHVDALPLSETIARSLRDRPPAPRDQTGYLRGARPSPELDSRYRQAIRDGRGRGEDAE